MPHVTLVSLSGFRVREPEMLALGMTLPGLHDRARAIAALPALAPLTLAAHTPEGWTQSILEAPAADDAAVQRILAEKPALVAISALTASIPRAIALSRSLRAEGVRTALGGLHATACPDGCTPHFDAVVTGDGEPVWPALLADAAAGSLRPLYRPERPFDLAESRPPRWDLLPPRDRPRFTLQTARGCPLACEFCAASRLLGPFREKPAEHVARELDAIRAIAPRPIVELADDNTFAGRRDPAPLLDALAASGARYFTEADWRIGERPDLLHRLADSGCVQVLVGLESLSPRFAGMGAKKARIDRMMDAVAAIHHVGVAVIGCFVVGADGEDEESLAHLADFLLDAPLADVQLTLLTPFPGTRLHRRLADQDRLLPDRGWDSYTLFDVVHRPDPLSPDQLQSAFHNLVKIVFSAQASARRHDLRRSVWARRGVAP